MNFLRNLKPITRIKIRLHLKSLPLYIIVLANLAVVAWFTSKYAEAIIFAVSFLTLRYKFDTTFHCDTTPKCMLLTLSIVYFAIPITLSINISLTVSAIIAFVVDYFAYLAGDRLKLYKRCIKLDTEDWRVMDEEILIKKGLTVRQRAVLFAIRDGIVGEAQIDLILNLGFDYSGSTQDREYKEIKRKLGIKSFKY